MYVGCNDFFLLTDFCLGEMFNMYVCMYVRYVYRYVDMYIE